VTVEVKISKDWSGKNNRLKLRECLVIILYERLSKKALHGVIEEFVTRDGTDYGLVEIDLEQKMRSVLRQLEKGEAFIVYDETTMTTNIVPKDEVTKAKYI
jgi:uncharacterized protein